MSKTLKQRVFTMMLVVLMAIASIPDSLIAYADDYSGSGGANTSVSEVSPQLAMNGNEYGIRVYCINDL